MDYCSAALGRISHGGNNFQGDSDYVIQWSTGYIGGTGSIASYSGEEFTWPDENFHHFIIYWKLNTDGNTDGAFSVWIDDVKVLEATGVVNRNDANTRGFQRLSFGDWTQECTSGDTYYIYYDDIVMASTYAEASGTSASTAPRFSGMTFRGMGQGGD